MKKMARKYWTAVKKEITGKDDETVKDYRSVNQIGWEKVIRIWEKIRSGHMPISKNEKQKFFFWKVRKYIQEK